MSTSLRFTVRDGDEEFQVTFTRKDDNLTASCTCPEGREGRFCEHRLALMTGNVDDLTSGNAEDLLALQSLIRGTDVGTALYQYINACEALNVAETSAKRARDALAKAMLY